MENEVAQHTKIFLTFDDGPTETTADILDILKQWDAHATFFVLGRQAEHYPDILRRIHQEGHAVGTHGYAHSYFKTRIGALRAELKKTEGIILRICGMRPKLFRPPWGIRGPLLKHSLRGFGYRTVLWDCDGKDWKSGISSQDIVKQIISHIKPSSIILLHDGCGGQKRCDRKQTAAALPEILKELSGKNYQTMSLPSN